MRRHCVLSPYCCCAIVSNVSPGWTSYVSPLAASGVVGVGVTAEATLDGDATGDASGGRCGLGTATVTGAVAGTLVGVGAAAPPPQAVTPNASTSPMAGADPPNGIRRELRFRRTLASPDCSNCPQYIEAPRRT